MEEFKAKTNWLWAVTTALLFTLPLTGPILLVGCARLPYTTKVLHENQRVEVTAQREVKSAGYTHPVQLSPEEVASLLRGFSIREQQRLPLRWFAEELPPKPIFREDEIQALAPYLAEGFQRIGPDERVHFEVVGPGFNPKQGNDVVAGWAVVREPYLYLTMEQFHTQVPTRKTDPYYSSGRYPASPPTPKNYLLYFEPGRFWITDQKNRRAVDFRQFLKSGEAGGTGDVRSIPPTGMP
jgi:hypothetical protein